MKGSRIALAAALALGLTMPPALPYTHAEATQGDRGPRHGGFKAMLGLSDEQAQAIRDIHARQSEARKQIGQSLRQAHQDLRQLALNGGTEEAIQAKRAEIEKLTGQMTDLHARALQEMAPILTPEQKEKLSQAGPGHPWGRRGHFHRQPS